MALTMLPSLGIKTWSQDSLISLAAKVSDIAARPLILIDGASGSGKTTLAVKLGEILNANLVHTDDISWCADPVHWDDEILAGIIEPWLAGEDIDYKPTGWIKENRSGSIAVNPKRALVIEGTGACREKLRAKATYSIWVDTEPEAARERVVQRDLANGENGGTIASVTEFAEWWDSLLIPLLLEEKAWKYADAVVSGSLSDLTSDHIMVAKKR